MENLLIIFIVVTGCAVVLQAIVMLGLYVTMKQRGARMEKMASEVHQRALPMLEKLTEAGGNLSAASATLRAQLERVDSTVSDVLDRTRLQVIRVDEMVTRTLDRVEETTEVVQHTVISPVKQIAGLASGLTAGLGAFFGRRRQQPRQPETQDEELFI
jgi:chromatin segregation and condensation protein Rec8/ScpA/Scc1 (kleisin family)